ncbi:MAG: threonine--tRNA ligase [Acidobacteria bacterium]|nr:threonine--tRNA ligase [Acidobacteriota bacterium]
MSSKAGQTEEANDLYRIRHSSAHVMAQAVLELFPEAKLAIGPPIQDGFYYDFDLPRPLTPEDLEQIESRARKILGADHRFESREINAEEARELFADQPYKIELINDILRGGTDEYGEPLDSAEAPRLTTFRQDAFEDLCRGPHVESTQAINPGAFKILHTAGAYWRGDEHRPMLQRIYGTAWKTPEDLEAYLHKLEEAKRRDHRKLGKRLDLFSTSEAVGPGLTLWHPKGALVRYLAERFSLEAHILNGYQLVYTPHIGRAGLWKTSGHLEFYKDAMFSAIESEGEEYYLKPMNCPFHIEIYKSNQRSYRDLPLRLAEFGTVYRYERSGVLQGLTRVRGFTQDDAHTFCRPDQIDAEILLALRFSLYVLRAFGLEEFTAYISTRPEGKDIGSVEDWDKAVETLRGALEAVGVPYEYDLGGGAFYGPKIDVKLRDSLGREWQLSTVQLDFNLPERFDMAFTGEDGKPHRPMMVHRALFGSVERFFAMLVEHYAGAFPMWLAPVQASLIPISDKQAEYANAVAARLQQDNVRTSVDTRDERMQAKIRDFEIETAPYALVVGKREAAEGTVSVRSRDRGDLKAMTVEAFLEMTREERESGKPTKLE